MSALTYQLAFAVGALFVSFLVLGLLLYICEKLRRKPNGPKQIAGMGFAFLDNLYSVRWIWYARRWP